MSLQPFGLAALCLPIVHCAVLAGESDLRDLHSTNPEKLVSVKGAVLTQRRVVVEAGNDVLKKARNGKRPVGGDFRFSDPRVIAIQILGEFRATESVDEILMLVEFKVAYVFRSEGPGNIGDYYPAAGALVKIGKPAVRPAVWELTKNPTARRRENLCWVIGEIEGAKAGCIRIEEQIAELEKQAEKALAKKQNPRPVLDKIEQLRSAIPVLEKLFPPAK